MSTIVVAWTRGLQIMHDRGRDVFEAVRKEV